MSSAGWWLRLFSGSTRADATQRLERIEQQLAELGRQIAALRSAGAPESDGAHIAALQEALLGLEKQVGRSGREQFKANTIAEAQAAQLAEALEQLRAADSRRVAEIETLREQQRREQIAARRAAAQELLPALDSLDEALRSGRQLLAASTQPAAVDIQANVAPASGGWLRQLFGEPQHATANTQLDTITRQLAQQTAAIDAWVAGLTFVRKRLLDTLAAADVRPITALGQPFDPQLHVAIGVMPPAEEQPPGTVVEELRRGYMAGERILRHAEVLVAANAEQQLEEQKDR